MNYVLKLTCPQYTCLLCLTTQSSENGRKSHEKSMLRQRVKLNISKEKVQSFAFSKETFNDTTSCQNQNQNGQNGVWRRIVKLRNMAVEGRDNLKQVMINKKKSGAKKPKKLDNRVKSTHLQQISRMKSTRNDHPRSTDKVSLIEVRLPSDFHIKNIVFCFTDFPHTCSKEQASIRYRIVYIIPISLIDSLMKILCSYIIGRCYVSADKILLHGARAFELSLKWSAVLSKRENRQQCLDLLLDVAVACYIAAVKNINILDSLKSTATSITQTAATNTATLGIESAVQVVGNAVAGAAISAIVDVAVSSASIYMAKRQKDEGRMTDKEFSIKIKKTVCESSFKFVGGTTGSILGQVLIPVPVVGAFVGGFCGSLIGAGIGKGINYGIFDRNSKKDADTIPADDDNNSQLRIYKREYHGHVPKIIVYYEDGNYFAEKTFERGKNQTTWLENVDKTTKKVNEKLTSPSIINRWKNRTEKAGNDRDGGAKQDFPMMKWKTVASSVIDMNNSVNRPTKSLLVPPSNKAFSLDDDNCVNKERVDNRTLRLSLSWDSHLKRFASIQPAAENQSEYVNETKIVDKGESTSKVSRLKRLHESLRRITQDRDSLFFTSDSTKLSHDLGDIPKQIDETGKESDKPLKQFKLFPLNSFNSVKGTVDAEGNVYEKKELQLDAQQPLDTRTKSSIRNLKELFVGPSVSPEERSEQEDVSTDGETEKSSFGKRASMFFSLRRKQRKVQSPDKLVTEGFHDRSLSQNSHESCSVDLSNGDESNMYNSSRNSRISLCLSNSSSSESLFNEPWFDMSSRSHENAHCSTTTPYIEKQSERQCRDVGKTTLNIQTKYVHSDESNLDGQGITNTSLKNIRTGEDNETGIEKDLETKRNSNIMHAFKKISTKLTMKKNK